uniref:Ig-like domain-containing protein n=1 Tax=Spermophilus dauricus TaxID=99837 RepID=A0A8C9UW33_SPEDA
MQPPSASPCRGGISWQGVLLAVSLLTFWNPHPTAQLTIEPVPFDAAEGRDVLLLVHNVSGNTVGVSWYRGQITDRSRLIVSYSNITHSAAQGPAFSGREIVYPNGSLLEIFLSERSLRSWVSKTIFPYGITLTSLISTPGLPHTSPRGTYFQQGPGPLFHLLVLMCLEPSTGLSGQFHMPHQLSAGGEGCKDQGQEHDSALNLVCPPHHRAFFGLILCLSGATEKLPKPNITINNSQPMEGEDSLALTCEPEISYATYLWKINSQRIPDGDRLKLSNNNRTLTLFSVTRNDTGPYECETQNPVSASRSDPLTLNISYGPDAPIINPPDSHIRPGTNLNLSCHADSNPPAQFSWSFNGRPLNPHKSSQSPTSLQIIADPMCVSPITLSLTSIGPQPRTLPSLVSGPGSTVSSAG